MSDTQHVLYVDESGNEDLETHKAGASDLFVVCALALERDSVADAEAIVQGVRDRFFSGGELKSSSVGGNVQRRQSILEALTELPALVYFLVVDKAAVPKESGLKWKKSFRKNISHRAYDKLYRRFPEAELVADRHGGTEFMAEFERYVARRAKESMFDRVEFRFIKDKGADPLVQAADFFGGTVRRCVEDALDGEERQLMRLVEPMLLAFHDYPSALPVYAGHLDQPPNRSLEDDWFIQRQAILAASDFVNRRREEAESDPAVALQVECAEYLLYRFKFYDQTEYVHTHELIEKLSRPGRVVKAQGLRTGVIAPLRDAGVLVSSSAAGGYKIPSSIEDVEAFLDIASRNVEPLIGRVAAYREAVRAASIGRLDILSDEKYSTLSRLVDALGPSAIDWQPQQGASEDSGSRTGQGE